MTSVMCVWARCQHAVPTSLHGRMVATMFLTQLKKGPLRVKGLDS